MQQKRTGKRMTRKEFREEKARKSQRGLIILKTAYYSIRTLIALVFELLRWFYDQ
ncbi:hypothetical protein [Sporosarcina ureilytica]|uniref:hypothetical protein n=1 Tax=Sporosarcina ureilytica TaxID=298596 RepID=UPI0012DB41E1|nr:hypothetical protein [Sporosarcina ureilytica]